MYWRPIGAGPAPRGKCPSALGTLLLTDLREAGTSVPGLKSPITFLSRGTAGCAATNPLADRSRRRGDRTGLFAAVHESVVGPLRRKLMSAQISAIGGQAELLQTILIRRSCPPRYTPVYRLGAADLNFRVNRRQRICGLQSTCRRHAASATSPRSTEVCP
jgi:hypothetical protein